MNSPVEVFLKIQKSLAGVSVPSVQQIQSRCSGPFHILIPTLISLRTKDSVTLAASRRLFSYADTPQQLAQADEHTISSLIYPCGFYSVKARRIIEISRIITERYAGSVPGSLELLLELPGVGRKTANLTLNLGFGIPAVCVDIHVHRISNLLGWAETSGPDQTEEVLMSLFPKEFWIDLNSTLVTFGQNCCLPRNPRCAECPVESLCPKHGVSKKTN